MNLKAYARLASYLSALILLTVTICSTASAEWKEKVLYSFQSVPDGAVPAGGVVFDAAGNLYGATTDGGAFGCAPTPCGTVFQVAPPAKKGGAWTETVLHIFKGNASGDGNTPAGGLVIDSFGNLYGTTAYGGTGNCVLVGGTVGCGTVFELSPPAHRGGAWTETVLYSLQGGKDGYLPSGDLVFDSKGNLYGATEYGGGHGSCNAPYYQYCGTVFQLSPPKTKSGKWKEQVLYSFKSDKDGANPNGGLILDGKGAIYGTTLFGGGQGCKSDSGIGCGTAFRLNPPLKNGDAWSERVLHRFTDGTDGAAPVAGLTLGNDGRFYGTAASGGSGNGLGVVFRLAATKSGSWTDTVLYNFQGGNDGRNPWGPVTLDSGGNLYGTATSGSDSFGVVFRLKSPAKGKSWSFVVLKSLTNRADGAYPTANLIFDQEGGLYSTTQTGGAGCQGACGTVFRVTP